MQNISQFQVPIPQPFNMPISGQYSLPFNPGIMQSGIIGGY